MIFSRSEGEVRRGLLVSGGRGEERLVAASEKEVSASSWVRVLSRSRSRGRCFLEDKGRGLRALAATGLSRARAAVQTSSFCVTCSDSSSLRAPRREGFLRAAQRLHPAHRRGWLSVGTVGQQPWAWCQQPARCCRAVTAR